MFCQIFSQFGLKLGGDEGGVRKCLCGKQGKDEVLNRVSMEAACSACLSAHTLNLVGGVSM